MLTFYAGCRVERSHWEAAQAATIAWRDSTAIRFAADSARQAEQTKQLAAQATILEASRDSAVIVANQARAVASVSLQKVTTLRQAVGAARDTAELVTALTTLVANQDTLIRQKTQETSALRETIRTDSSLIGKLHLQVESLNGAIHARDLRLVSLDSALTHAATPPPVKWLGFIPRPSRGVMFLAGGVLTETARLLLQARKP